MVDRISEVPKNPLTKAQTEFRDRPDWPEIEASILGFAGLEDLEKTDSSPEELLKGPLANLIPRPKDPDFDAFCEYTRRSKPPR